MVQLYARCLEIETKKKGPLPFKIEKFVDDQRGLDLAKTFAYYTANAIQTHLNITRLVTTR
jgi:hypothetical protein